LLAGALLVLLVAILDVTNLSLVRQVERRTAWAVRSALGAPPGRLILEAAAEAGLIAIFATIVGAGVARVALGLLGPLAPADLPRVAQLGQGGMIVLGTSAVIAALGTSLSIVLPAWRATRVMPGSALHGRRGTASGTTGGVLRQGITTVQVGLTVWVLVMGVLMSRTVSNLRSLDLGFSAENLVLVGLDYVGDGVEAPPGLADRLLRATARIRATPQVVATSPMQMPPMPGNAAWQTILFREEQTQEQAVDENPFLFMEFVEADFFNALDAPVVRGRSFTEGDRPGSLPVLLLNESAARLYYPGGTALGERVNLRFPGTEDVPSEIVGVVGDTRYGDLTEIKPTVYFPIRQVDAFHSRYILVRTDGTPLDVRSVVRDALATEAPDFRPMSVASVQTLLDAPLVRPRFAATVVGILAALAFFLAAIGMYGVMTFYVRSRRPDIGVRIACGASPAQARGLVIRSGLVLGVIGGIGGVLAALGTGSVMESLLFGVAPTDPLSLGLALVLGMLGAFAACVLPARRAAAIDPAQLLRSE
jgi:predicted permease